MTPETYKDLQKARLRLEQGVKTFVVYRNNTLLFQSEKRGLAPYFDALESDPAIFDDTIIGDRIIGRAAAYLFLNSKAKAVFSLLMTYDAVTLLESSSCTPTWKDTIPFLVNRETRANDRLDELLLNVTHSEEALALIKANI